MKSNKRINRDPDTCGICSRRKRFDASKEIRWCPACDYNIPGLSQNAPDGGAPNV